MLAKQFRLTLPFVHWCELVLSFPRLATGLRYGITPQFGFSVDFGQFVNTLVKHQLVFHIAHQVGYL